ncbi:hypothetical protein BTQ_804 [Burkholderia thailandensis 2002721723]|nr:hypothetical protein BTQ_804 [Burkholderia thailandensis 2002721723]
MVYAGPVDAAVALFAAAADGRDGRAAAQAATAPAVSPSDVIVAGAGRPAANFAAKPTRIKRARIDVVASVGSRRAGRAADGRPPHGGTVPTRADRKRRSARDRRHHEARHPERSIRRAAADDGVRPRGGRCHARPRRLREGWRMDALRLQGGPAHRPQVVNYRRDSRRHRSFSAVPFSYPPRQGARSYSPHRPCRAGITLPVLIQVPAVSLRSRDSIAYPHG